MTPRYRYHTRWQILDKACLAVDPECKVRCGKDARAKVEARLASLTPEGFEAEMRETVEFLARMRARTLEVQAEFNATLGMVKDFRVERPDYAAMYQHEKAVAYAA